MQSASLNRPRQFNPFEQESEVRTYCRRMPAVFKRALNAEVWDEEGRRYIDFLSVCGAMNYGHNNPTLKAELLDFLNRDGLGSALDLHTVEKRKLLSSLRDIILRPHGLDYKVQFPGPTGTNAIEAAIKLARKVTGRQSIVAFSNGFHGMTLGALALTGNKLARGGAGVPLQHVVRLPYDGYMGATSRELIHFEHLVNDPSGGCDAPAAFVVETVQGEGGLNVASNAWLQTMAATAKRMGSLLIIDDVQAGCGRTGTFFSFERAKIQPDIVCLSKSISGFGLPMSLVLIDPSIDAWKPGEHNGTFRGNTFAFVTAAAALDFWRSPSFKCGIEDRAATINTWIQKTVAEYPHEISPRGIGLMQGLSFSNPAMVTRIAKRAFKLGVLIETCGPFGEVLKIMPPLTIEPHVLNEGLSKLGEAIQAEQESTVQYGPPKSPSSSSYCLTN